MRAANEAQPRAIMAISNMCVPLCRSLERDPALGQEECRLSEQGDEADYVEHDVQHCPFPWLWLQESAINLVRHAVDLPWGSGRLGIRNS